MKVKMKKEDILKIVSGIIGFCFLPCLVLQIFPNELYLIRDTFIFNFLFAFMFFKAVGGEE